MQQALFLLLSFFTLVGTAQTKLWTEDDRKFVHGNMDRTKMEMIAVTENLSPEQWHYKPDADSWCIAQVVEHIGLYERLVYQEAMVANALPPRPELFQEQRSDEEYIAWMAETNPHVAPENAVPLGFMKAGDNLKFFKYGRDLILEYLKTTDKDLKAQFIPRNSEPNKMRSIHGLMIVHFGHTDRHLRQIERIKASPQFPAK
jgi:hypothetical protein